MSTATEISDRDIKARNKRVFEYQVESFLNQWKPADRREASQFEAQLIMLIRQVHVDAQEPILEQLTKVITSLPITSLKSD